MTTAPTPARTQTPAAPAANTPTPWTLHEIIPSEPGQTGVLNIRASDFNVTAFTHRHGTRDHADAALIVSAVNAHAGLLARVAELEAALALCETRLNVAAKQSGTRPATRAEFAGAAEIARAALAKEGGK